jgi:hypothetical protein
MQVLNFDYNGFTVAVKKTVATFTAEFIEWTADPGVAHCKCSDGTTRLIPTCALIGFRCEDYPEQDNSRAKKIARKFGIYLGKSSSSKTPHIALGH